MVVVVDEEVLDAVVAHETTRLVKGHRERAVPRTHLQRVIGALCVSRDELDERTTKATALVGWIDGEVLNLEHAIPFIGYHADPNRLSRYIEGKHGTAPQITVYHILLLVGKQKQLKVVALGALKDASKPFPENLATGWFSTPTIFSVQLDFQQQKVIDRTIDKIIENVKRYQKQNPKFKFAGFSWDVPQPYGDFWDAEQATRKGRQITLSFWTGKDSGSKHPDVTHDYATYSEGYFEFFRQLRERVAKELNPNVKFIVEPYNVYNDWMRYMDWDFMKSKGDKRAEYMPDLIRDMKTAAHRFVADNHSKFPLFDGWGKSYCALSVSYGDRTRIINYIKGQKEHHRKASLADELKNIFKEHDVEYDTRYLLTD